jgi:trimeric autotransporter adhesin
MGYGLARVTSLQVSGKHTSFQAFTYWRTMKSIRLLSATALLLGNCTGMVGDDVRQNSPPISTSIRIASTSTDTPVPTPTRHVLPTLQPTPALEIPKDLSVCLRTTEVEFGCVVTTFAGGDYVDIGDDGLATNAQLAFPTDIYVSEDGWVYISDSLHGRIRVINHEGIIDTFIGAGTTYAAAIDGALPEDTFLRRPDAMTIGPDGLFYFSDSKHHLVRRIDTNGTVTTIAGGNLSPVQGGTLGDAGKATNASLTQPAGLAFDSDKNLYIADTINNRVRRVDQNGIITTILGYGSSLSSADYDPGDPHALLNPEGLAIDDEDRMYVGHTGDTRVYNIRTGEASILDGLAGVTSIVAGVENQVYFASPGGNKVYRLASTDCLNERTGSHYFCDFQVIAGRGSPGFSGDGGAAVNAELHTPTAIALDREGNLYIVDTFNHRVRIVDRNGTISTLAGRQPDLTLPISFPASETVFYVSNGLAFDSYGALYITDYDLNTIRRIDPNGYATVVAGNGITAFSGDGEHPTLASMNAPRAIVFDQAGSLFFIDESNDSQVVRRISPGEDGIVDGSADEIISTVVGIPGGYEQYGITRTDNVPGIQAIFNSPRGIDFDSQGNLYIADWLGNRILKVTPGEDGIISGEDDEIVTTITGTGEQRVSGNGGLAIEARVANPWWIALDSNDNIYFYEHDNVSPGIRRIDGKTGIISSFITPGMLNVEMPSTFVFDSDDNLYIANSAQVFRVNLITREIRLVAGNGAGGSTGRAGGFSGDGGDARKAGVQFIQFLAVDSQGDLYFDDGNLRIRKVTFVPIN